MIDFRGFVEFLRDTLSYFITAAIIAFVFIFIIAIVPVVGNSMSPTLNDGDLTVVIRFIYEFKDVERGDIVNIKTTVKKHKRRIKNIDTGQIFESINCAIAFYGVERAHISDACSGKREKCLGYRWEYVDN